MKGVRVTVARTRSKGRVLQPPFPDREVLLPLRQRTSKGMAPNGAPAAKAGKDYTYRDIVGMGREGATLGQSRYTYNLPAGLSV